MIVTCQSCQDVIKHAEENGQTHHKYKTEFINEKPKFASRKELIHLLVALTFASALFIERWFIGFQVCLYLYALVDLYYMLDRYHNRKFIARSQDVYRRKGTYLTSVSREISSNYAAASAYYSKFDDVSNLLYQMDNTYQVDLTFNQFIGSKLSILKHNLLTRCNPIFIWFGFLIGFSIFMLMYRLFMLWVIS